MHASLDDCNAAIESVRDIALMTADMSVRSRQITSHYFNLTSPEGQVIGKSEMYESSAGMENGIASVKKNGISTIVVEE